MLAILRCSYFSSFSFLISRDKSNICLDYTNFPTLSENSTCFFSPSSPYRTRSQQIQQLPATRGFTYHSVYLHNKSQQIEPTLLSTGKRRQLSAPALHGG